MVRARGLDGLSGDEVTFLKKGYSRLFLRKANFANAFYCSLFTHAPELRQLFSGDEVHQKEMLLSALTLVLRALDAPVTFADELDRLARLHARKGLTPAQLEPGKIAFQEAVCTALGGDSPRGELSAWGRLFTALIEEFQDRQEHPSPV